MSRFVPAGTDVDALEKDDEWSKAQHELETNRRLKEEQSRASDGKTLFEVLQANKVAKQEAFEEAARLKNQFRSLDDDEVDFLDSVLESTRAKEAAVRKETVEQLEVFRKQQEELEKAALAEQNDTGPVLETEETWQVGLKKRKRLRDKEGLVGVKLRKSSSTARETLPDPTLPAGQGTKKEHAEDAKPSLTAQPTAQPPASVRAQTQPREIKASAPAVASLGLAGYSSDDDDD